MRDHPAHLSSSSLRITPLSAFYPLHFSIFTTTSALNHPPLSPLSPLCLQVMKGVKGVSSLAAKLGRKLQTIAVKVCTTRAGGEAYQGGGGRRNATVDLRPPYPLITSPTCNLHYYPHYCSTTYGSPLIHTLTSALSPRTHSCRRPRAPRWGSRTTRAAPTTPLPPGRPTRARC